MNMRALFLAAAAAAALPSALAWAGDVTGNTYTVYVFDREFSQNHPFVVPPTSLPDDPTILLGDTVMWVLVNGMHTVTGVGGQSEDFGSGMLMEPSETYSHTFTHLGDFNYYCQFHGFDAGGGQAGGMAGVVHVVPTPGSAAALLGLGTLTLRRRR